MVTGILIALQVSNWNQDRQDARRGHEYLQRLRGDIASDRKANDNWRRFNGQVVAYGRQALAHGDAGTLVDGSAWKTVRDQDDAQELADCPSPVPEDEAAAVLQGYGEDKALLPELRYWLANRQVAFMVDVNRGRQARELEAKVSAALSQ